MSSSLQGDQCGVMLNGIDEVLKERGRVVTVPVGYSMWPMLKNRKDHIVIESVKKPLRKYDVPLYRYDFNVKYVLHRIIKIKKDGRYVICGDNLVKKEYEVTDKMISGVLVGFYKGKRYIDCETNKMYHAYVYIWRFLYPIRVILIITKRCLGKIKRKIMNNSKGN